MRLAEHLHKSLNEILELDSNELAYWDQYLSMFPPYDPWYATASICWAASASCHGNPKPKVEDFLPFKKWQPPTTEEEEEKAMAARIAKAKSWMDLANNKEENKHADISNPRRSARIGAGHKR